MSNINGISSNYDRRAYVSETAEQKKDAGEKPPVEQKKENAEVTVSLSSDSRDLQMAKQAATSASENGNGPNSPEKIDKLKQEVENGNYQVNPMQVADKIVGRIIDELL